jgi:hypothetical protein
MINIKSLNQILNDFFEIELLPTTSIHLKIRVMPMFLIPQLFKFGERLRVITVPTISKHEVFKMES